MLRDRDVFLSRRFIVVPSDVARVPGLIDQTVDLGHRVVERESPEIGPERKNPVVPLAEVCKDARSRIHDQKMIEGAEKTHGGHCREFLQPLDNHHLAIADINTTDEYTKTIRNEGGVKVGEYRH